MSLKKILIVDADRETSEQIASACRDFNYRVGVLSEGSGLIEEVTEDPPDLIVLNIELPDQNGFVLCKEIRSKKDLKKVAIILTSKTSDEKIFEKHRKLKDAANAYFLKPFSMEDLIDQIEQLIGLPPPPSPAKEASAELEDLRLRVTQLEDELQKKEQEAKMFRESYENVSVKLDRSRSESKGLEEALKKGEEQLTLLAREQAQELENLESKKNEEISEIRKQFKEMAEENKDLQKKMAKEASGEENLRKQLEVLERRSRLSEEENLKREGNLKNRIQDLLGQVDEAKELNEALKTQIEELSVSHEEQKKKLSEDLQILEQERIKMEQRVIKAYKKIKMDQLRDEKLKKALHVALTLLES